MLFSVLYSAVKSGLMFIMNKNLALIVLIICLASPVLGIEEERYLVAGLEKPAEILVDRWGVPHIYANTHYDAFFVQGFNAARDRLWQIDLWRRRGLGELSAVLGDRYLQQDRAARLFLYRGGMFREWLAYGSDAKRIAGRFVAGINAYVDLVSQNSDLLPIEFRMLGYEPHRWEASDVVRIRSNGLWRNLVYEVMRAQFVCKLGLENNRYVKKLEPPWQTIVPEGLEPCEIPKDVARVYSLAKAPVIFGKQATDELAIKLGVEAMQTGVGSNNWAVSGDKTTTGRPILADDPHRGHGVPSLRYIAHLSAPGVNVIGAGEPALPGISIGHNERIAFGLTIFSIDQEDLLFYRTHPQDPNQYWYRGAWEKLRNVKENVPLRNGKHQEITLQFTRHGPVIYSDESKNRIFAVYAAWLEPGMAPYFGSIEYMRAQNWDQFLAALNRWGAPAENQVYADTDGNIGYKPAGLAPIRKNWDGLLPVPGDGRYEWQGYYDMDELPVEFNPDRDWVATANAMSLPDSFPYKERLLGLEWAAPWRISRITEVLSRTGKHSLSDSTDLQRDYVSIPASRLLPLAMTAMKNTALVQAKQVFQGWDYSLDKDSAAAALFEIWFSRHLGPATIAHLVGVAAPIRELPVDTLVVVEELEKMPVPARDELITLTLESALQETRERLGDNKDNWQWGALHHMKFKHPLYELADKQEKELLAFQEVSRGGSADTPNSTRYSKSSFDVVSGASWRMVVDVGNWDAATMTNAPGQSGDPRSEHYDDLLEMWGDDKSVPLLYSRGSIEANLKKRIQLQPIK
jgi:penicillin amidase